MPLEDPEKTKEYQRLYYEKNKERIKEKQRLYREKNKGKNKERRREYDRLYHQTEKGIKSYRISKWKRRGVVCHDFEELYKTYMNVSFCDFCKVELTYDKTITSTTKCLDHDHVSGEFRNILCHSCNVKRR